MSKFLLANDIDLSSFIERHLDISRNVYTSGSELRGEWSPFLFALYKNNIKLAMAMLPYISLNTKVATIPGKNGAPTRITMENILLSGNFYNNFPESAITYVLSHFNDKNNIQGLREKRTQYPGILKNEDFVHYVFPALLKNKSYELLSALSFPILYHYPKITNKIMQFGDKDDIDFWLDLTEKNKKNFINTVKEKENYAEAKSIIPLLENIKENKEILLDMLSPENIFTMLVSSSKKTEEQNILKMDYILNLFSEELNVNFINSLYESAKKLNTDNIDSILVNKNTPVAYAIIRKMTKTLNYFVDLGYVLNEAEDNYLQGIVKSEEKFKSADNVNIYDRFVNLANSNGKRAINQMEEFFSSLSEHEKINLFNQIKEINEDKEKGVKLFYPIKTSQKELKEISAQASATMGLILKNNKEMLLILLKNGYKLTQKEYGLTYIMFSRWIENSSGKTQNPMELSFSVADFMKSYPEVYKEKFLINVLNGLFMNKKDNDLKLESYDLCPIVNAVINEDYIALTEKDIPVRLKLNQFNNLSENGFYSLVLTLYKNTNLISFMRENRKVLEDTFLKNNFFPSHRMKNIHIEEQRIIKKFFDFFEEKVGNSDFVNLKAQLLSKPMSSLNTEFLEHLLVENEKEKISQVLPEKILVEKKNINRI